jgi:hypothetical protein
VNVDVEYQPQKRRRILASSGDGGDLTAGETNFADSGTELICGPANGITKNDYVLRVVGGLLLQGQVNGVRVFGTRPTLNRGVWSEGDVGLLGVGLNSVGVWGWAPASYGVLGESTSNAGVVGRSTDSAVGVWGSANTNYGVLGESVSHPGVEGRSTNSVGVEGISTNSVGLWGRVNASYGVLGESTSNAGVVGRSTDSAVGVWGSANTNYGVLGESVSNAGVVGRSTDSVGVEAISTNSFAGHFIGPVHIDGNLTGTGVKGAVVQHPDGSHRLLCAVESPESWFEDFGDAVLANGRAEVQLDHEFVSVIETSTYHVFLTPYGDSNGLYVANRTDRGFLVQEQKGGTSNLTFSYRIVAKRKGIVNDRLPKVTLPAPAASVSQRLSSSNPLSPQPVVSQGSLPMPSTPQPSSSAPILSNPLSPQPPVVSERNLPMPSSPRPSSSEPVASP